MFELLLLREHCLVDVVVLLANAAEGGGHLLVFFVAELPGRDHVVGLEESVPGDETVLGSPVVISEQRRQFKFKSFEMTSRPKDRPVRYIRECQTKETGKPTCTSSCWPSSCPTGENTHRASRLVTAAALARGEERLTD